MREIELLLKTVADGLKTMAEGLTMIAKKVDTIAKNQVKAKPSKSKAVPLKKAKKAPRKPIRRTRNRGPLTATEKVYGAIKKAVSDIDNATLCAHTGLDKNRWPTHFSIL